MNILVGGMCSIYCDMALVGLFAFMQLYNICNLGLFCPFFFLSFFNLVLKRQTAERSMVPASPNFISLFFFTRAIPMALTFGL